MLRCLFLLILSSTAAYGGVVDGVKRSKNRILIGLEAGEVGLFQYGDEVQISVRRSPQKFKARVARVFGKDLIAVEPQGKIKYPKKNRRIDIQPAYRNKNFDNDVGTRAPNGKNQYDERNIIAIEGGNHLKPDMIGYGGRYHFYGKRRQSFSIGYSYGKQEKAATYAESEMGSVQTRYFFSPKLYLTGGLGLKRNTVILNSKFVDEGGSEETKDIPWDHPEAKKIANVVESAFIETGFGAMQSFESLLIGNVFILGIDLLTLQTSLYQ